MPTKINLYKNNYVEDLISFKDYIIATGLDEDEVYTDMLEGPWEREEDGDFVYRIDLSVYKESIRRLKRHLPVYVIRRNKFGVEYTQ